MQLNVIIHCGPPKTGTSSIQKWLNTHTSQLLSKGIYYPAHELDANGISSGNHTSIFDFNGKTWSLSLEKVKHLQSAAIGKNANTLLLSSEVFFRRLPLVAKAFTTFTLIGYVRCPVEVIESSYNQSVKRNFNTAKIKFPKNLKAENLSTFTRFLKGHPNIETRLRPFDEKLFFKQNLIADFLDTISCAEIFNDLEVRVNPSYCFEALEFMRWINQFEQRQFHSTIDLWLQQFLGATTEFSLIPPDNYQLLIEQYADKVNDFCVNWNVEQQAEFVRNLKNKPQKPFREQKLSSTYFANMLEKLLSERPEVLPFFQSITAVEGKDSFNQPEFFAVVDSAIKSKNRYSAFKSLIKRFIRR